MRVEIGRRARSLLRRGYCKTAAAVATPTSSPSAKPSPSSRVTTGTSLFPNALVYRRGDHPYGSREYLLVQPDNENTNQTLTHSSAGHHVLHLQNSKQPMRILSCLKAHRNIVFGARVLVPATHSPNGDATTVTLMQDACRTLLRAALDDCSNDGEQAQAISTLHGLSAYVRDCLTGKVESPAWNQLMQDHKDPSVLREAVEAMANMTASAAKSPAMLVGPCTDGGAAWQALAREFVHHPTMRSDECQLYQAADAQLVQIELLADTEPSYLASAGGAMGRFFFL
jgi:hypothetical protein